MLYIWKLDREINGGNEIIGTVVVANTDTEARQVATAEDSREDASAWMKSRSRCVRIGATVTHETIGPFA
jgi:hypothetical protein